MARAAVAIELTDEEERELRALLRRPSVSQQQALRARIVLRARGFGRDITRKLRTRCRSINSSNVSCRLSARYSPYVLSGQAKVGRHHGKRTYDIRLVIRSKRRVPLCGRVFKYYFTHRNRVRAADC